MYVILNYQLLLLCYNILYIRPIGINSRFLFSFFLEGEGPVVDNDEEGIIEGQTGTEGE